MRPGQGPRGSGVARLPRASRALLPPPQSPPPPPPPGVSTATFQVMSLASRLPTPLSLLLLLLLLLLIHQEPPPPQRATLQDMNLPLRGVGFRDLPTPWSLLLTHRRTWVQLTNLLCERPLPPQDAPRGPPVSDFLGNEPPLETSFPIVYPVGGLESFPRDSILILLWPY